MYEKYFILNNFVNNPHMVDAAARSFEKNQITLLHISESYLLTGLGLLTRNPWHLNPRSMVRIDDQSGTIKSTFGDTTVLIWRAQKAVSRVQYTVCPRIDPSATSIFFGF